MAAVEIDSFVTKFKHLCSLGIVASLNFESNDGEMTVSLNAKLGNLSNPMQFNYPVRRRSPAYERRQARRKASWPIKSEAEEASMEKASNLLNVTEKPVNDVSENASDKVAEKVALTELSVENKIVSEENAKQTFVCDKCDFETSSSIRLKVHSKCLHSETTTSQLAKMLKEKYESTEHYWKTGRLGISYQSYVEALSVIDACLPRYEQVVERDLLLEARKKQFGIEYSTYPPWCKT